jgi:hypothetical protein
MIRLSVVKLNASFGRESYPTLPYLMCSVSCVDRLSDSVETQAFLRDVFICISLSASNDNEKYVTYSARNITASPRGSP